MTAEHVVIVNDISREEFIAMANDRTFEAQAAMNAAKQVDDRNTLLTDALATISERLLIYAMQGKDITTTPEWPNIRAMVREALLTSTDPYALRVARLLGGEGE